MDRKFFSKISFIFILFLGILFWGKLVIDTHPKEAIVSWDEGFHGGSALFISECLRNNFSFKNYTYILNDFKNGIIWYLPLWWGAAGLMGAIFTPSVGIYRFTTLLFAAGSIILVVFFAKSIGGIKAGIISGVTLAMVPVFIIYSHLMMVEIPLLFSTSLALLFFYRYLTKLKVTKFDFLITLISFIVGVSTKITAIAVIFGDVVVFGIFLRLFYFRSEISKRFYSWRTLYFLISSFLTFTLFRQFERKILNADLLGFYLGQAKQMTGEQSNIIFVMIKIITHSFTFYLRDLSHMPSLAVLWLGSFIAYVILKRSVLAYFLLIWVIVTYVIFSMVKPQAVQYILPIFVPLSLSVGLFWSEFIRFRRDVIANYLLVLIIASIVFLGLINLDKSETVVWRNTISNQNTAADFVADHANFGDRVITTGDGTRLLVRLAGFDKKLQTVNGAAPLCSEFIQDSVEWGILDNGPQSPVRLKQLGGLNWKQIIRFPGSIEDVMVLRNNNPTRKVNLNNIDPLGKKCIRLLLVGRNEINIFATTFLTKESLQGDFEISLKVNPLKTLKYLTISKKDLQTNNGTEQRFSFALDQTQPNQPVYLSFNIPSGLRLLIREIQINKLESI